MEIYKDTNLGDIAEYIANIILEKLKEKKKVLWFVAGGSSIPLAVEVSRLIGGLPHQNLTVTLTDERYGELGHADSNWDQLASSGFNLPEANLIPILYGGSMDATVEKFNNVLENELRFADYCLGLFGVGSDGHTAGILPHSRAISSENFAYGYFSNDFDRITMTPKAIKMLDEAIVFMQGKDKSGVMHDLNREIPIAEQPAQILKLLPKLTVFYNSK